MEAEAQYRDLINANSDNVNYLLLLHEALGLVEPFNDSKIEKLIALYGELSLEHPRSYAINRMPLNYVYGDKFKKMLKTYLIGQLRKGVPSLFNSVTDLLKDSEKAVVILEITKEFYQNLLSNGTFNESKSDEMEPPSAFLWVAFFLAQYYDYVHNTKDALHYINTAIGHSPTAVELYMAKARIYKHAGDVASAAEAMEEARTIDLQDRFVNSKCTKYMLRNNQIQLAAHAIALFAKPNAEEAKSGSAEQDLIDMQCIWYAFEVGQAHQRLKQYGLALKRYNQIFKHFWEFNDDLIDFHQYAVRKQTLRSYIQVVKNARKLHQHKFYVNSAREAINIHLKMFYGGALCEQMVNGVSLGCIKLI